MQKSTYRHQIYGINIRAITFCEFPLFNKREDTDVEIHLNWNWTQNQQTAMQMLLMWKPTSKCSMLEEQLNKYLLTQC